MILTYILIGLYILALIFIGLKDYKTEDAEGFIIADRKVGFFGTVSSMYSSLQDGGFFIFIVGIGFSMGYAFFLPEFIGLILGLWLMLFFVKRVRKIAIEKNYINITQVISSEIGVKTERFSSIIVIFSSLLIISSQLFVLGSLMHIILGIDAFVSIIFSGLIVSFYVSMGGYKSIVKTDILQFIIIAMLLSIMFLIPLKTEHIFNLESMYKGNTFQNIFFGIYVVIFFFGRPSTWQRILSAKSEKTVSKSVFFLPFVFIVLITPMYWLGMSARELIPDGIPADKVLLTIIQGGLYSKIVASFLTVILLSAIMSTIDTMSYLISSTLLEDFFRIDIKGKAKKYITVSRITTILIISLGCIISFFIENIMHYIFEVVALSILLSPIFLFSFLGIIKKSNKFIDLYFMMSLLISSLVWLGLFINRSMAGNFFMVCVPSFVCFILLSIGVMFYKLKYENQGVKK